MICLSHIRMRYAWKIQGRSLGDLPWNSGTFPWAPWWGLAWCILIILVQFYLSVWPLGTKPRAETFFANCISVPVTMLLYGGAKIYYRGRRWVDSSSIDLDESQRFYASQDEEESEVILPRRVLNCVKRG